ncbi:MAG TPA: GtrA family protein [Pseudonocardiaceae bacterium]
MTVAEAEVSRPGLVSQMYRFVIIGVVAAGIDYGTYDLLLHLGVPPYVSKGCSFILGTTFSYLANKKWTFNARGGAGQASKFAMLYVITFFVNVGVNQLGLLVFAHFGWRFVVSWVLAQGAATVINFVLLRLVVFRD